MDLGADGVELDVQLSRDGALMVFHDELLSRTTNGEGKLTAMTFAELRALDAGSRFNRSFAGEKIPTLDEVLAILPDGAVVDVEMKSETPEPEPLVETTLRTVRPYAPRLRLYLSCFSPKFLDLARSKGWVGEIGVLTGDDHWDWSFAKARTLGANIVLPYHENFEKVPAPDTSYFLMPYTVDDPDRALALLRAGCKGIISNRPGFLKSALRP